MLKISEAIERKTNAANRRRVTWKGPLDSTHGLLGGTACGTTCPLPSGKVAYHHRQTQLQKTGSRSLLLQGPAVMRATATNLACPQPNRKRPFIHDHNLQQNDNTRWNRDIDQEDPWQTGTQQSARSSKYSALPPQIMTWRSLIQPQHRLHTRNLPRKTEGRHSSLHHPGPILVAPRAVPSSHDGNRRPLWGKITRGQPSAEARLSLLMCHTHMYINLQRPSQ